MLFNVGMFEKVELTFLKMKKVKLTFVGNEKRGTHVFTHTKNVNCTVMQKLCFMVCVDTFGENSEFHVFSFSKK